MKNALISSICLLILSPFLLAQAQSRNDRMSAQAQSCPNNRGYKVHLSFDDGPKIPETLQILDTLKKHNVKATFLVSMSHFGNMAKGNPPNQRERRLIEVLERMKSEGHTIGSHSFDHIDHTNFSKHSEEQINANLERSFYVADRLGLQKPIPFRFPYGSGWLPTSNPMRQAFNNSLMQKLRQKGYQPFHWDLDTEDWSSVKRKALPGSLLQQVCQTGGGVVLMHDIHSWTANNLEPIIQSLNRSGHELVSYREILRYSDKRSLRDNPNVPNAPREETVSEIIPNDNTWSGGLY